MRFSNLQNVSIDELNFNVVDVETTGMYPQFNRVVDLALVRVSGGKIQYKRQYLINPTQAIPSWISKFTGLYDSHVENAPLFEKYASEIGDQLKEGVFVAHNAGFDYGFVQQELHRQRLPFSPPKLCTVLLSRGLIPGLPSYNLDVLSEFVGVKIVNRRRALPGAEATAVLLLDLIKLAKEKYAVQNFFDLERLQSQKPKKEFSSDYGLFSE